MKLRRHPGASLPPATVSVRFQGQLLLEPKDDHTCQVHVNYIAFQHELSIAISGKRPGAQEPELIGNVLRGRLEETFSIQKTTGGQGVFGFFADTFNRVSGDAQDLRWAIDLQHPREFHDPDQLTLTLDRPNVQPGISIKDGVFFVSERSDQSRLFVHRIRGEDNLDLPRIGTIIAAAISMQGNQKVKLSWKEGGAAQTLELPRPEGEFPTGTTYTVDIKNEPRSSGSGSVHDELVEYYRVLRDERGNPISVNERFSLEAILLGSFDGDRIPCMSVFLGE